MSHAFRPDPHLSFISCRQKAIAFKPEMSKLVYFFIFVADGIRGACHQQVERCPWQRQLTSIFPANTAAMNNCGGIHIMVSQILPVAAVAFDHSSYLPAKLI